MKISPSPYTNLFYWLWKIKSLQNEWSKVKNLDFVPGQAFFWCFAEKCGQILINILKHQSQVKLLILPSSGYIQQPKKKCHDTQTEN